VSFLVLFFFAGHLLESTFLPLEMVFEHRNYLPSIALILLAVVAINELFSRMELSKLSLPLAFVFMTLLSINTAIRADQWGDSLLLPLFEVEKNPSSPRANFEAARAYAIHADREQDADKKRQYIQKARDSWLESIRLDPNKGGAYVSLLILHLRNGLPVEDKWLKELERIISQEKVSSTTSSSFASLFNCLKKGDCILKEERIDSLIRHVMEMRQVDGLKRAIILKSISGFLWDYRREYKSAMAMMELVVRSAPDQGKLKVDYANMLLATGNHKQCGRVINQLDAIDEYGVFRKDIEKLRSASCIHP
jgi:tetratricopeptide (TPR) repeat protein